MQEVQVKLQRQIEQWIENNGHAVEFQHWAELAKADGYVNVADRLTYSYSASSTNPTHWVYTTSNIFTEFSIRAPGVFVAAGGIWGIPAPSSTTTSYTAGNTTYYRGPLQKTVNYYSSSLTYTSRYYSVAIVEG